MSKEGEFFITSKGRRFLRSNIGATSTISMTPLIRSSHPTLDPDYETEEDRPLFEGEVLGDDTLSGFKEGRIDTADTLTLLRWIKEEGPIPTVALEDWSNREMDWFTRNGYVKFIPFDRSQDINFESKLGKRYDTGRG